LQRGCLGRQLGLLAGDAAHDQRDCAVAAMKGLVSGGVRRPDRCDGHAQGGDGLSAVAVLGPHAADRPRRDPVSNDLRGSE